MSEGTLSQEEIDALLGLESPSSTVAKTPEALIRPDEGRRNVSSLSKEMSLLRTLLEGSVGDIFQSLKGSISADFQLSLVSATVVPSLPFAGDAVYLLANLQGPLAGTHAYVFTQSDALKILSPLLGMEKPELGDAALAALKESFEPVAKTLGASLSFQFGTVSTDGMIATLESPANLGFSARFGLITYTFEVGGKAGNLYEIFDESIVTSFLQESEPLEDIASSIGSSRAGAGMGLSSPNATSQRTTVQAIQFPQLQEKGSENDSGNLGLLMDVSMEMTVELGRTRKLIKEILGIGEGTIVELDKLAGEPVDILVNHKLIARGEVVVIDENFGVRITEIVSSFDRLKSE